MMSLFFQAGRFGTVVRLAIRSAFNRRVNFVLTLLSIMLSTCLLLSVQRGQDAIHDSFTRAVSGTDLIVGARTSALQLMFYTVFRLGDATHEISWKSYRQISEHPLVAWSIPLALGDSHRGYPVLGTTDGYFEHFRFGHRQPLSFADGKAFDDLYDVVLGARVASQLGYRPGDRITLTHGTSSTPGLEHADRPFRVSGILAATGTPVDRTLHISLEAMQAIHLNWQAGAPIPGLDIPADRVRAFDLRPERITGALVGLKSRAGVFNLQRFINTEIEEPLLAVLPAVALDQLWRLLDIVHKTLQALSILVLVLALCALVTALMASLEQRRRELAILRTIGARPHDLLLLLVLEGLLLTTGGALLGWLLLVIGSAVAAPLLQTHWGIVWPVGGLSGAEARLMALVALVGPSTALLPAWRASRRALATGLTMRI
ncbi:MAG: ABC transporter permease [Lautropia sp.]|nr:ABC transporter permease [Lautropia sp.]